LNVPYGRLLKDLQEFEQDEQAQDASVRSIAVIGEAANRIQKVATEFVSQHAELPCGKMRGIRNKVVHDYLNVARDVVSNTVREDLPPAVESGQKSVERAGEMHQPDGKTQ
jgi:uncharacterized protein with HEPN domain